MKKFLFLLIIFIIQASFSQTLEVVSPNGGENYAGGDKVYITWQASAGVSRVRIECSLNNGGEWYYINPDCSEKSCRWVVPYLKLTSSQTLIRITALDITNPPSDLSDAPFAITAAPTDPYEPNNTLNEAYDADINDTLWGAMTMKSSSDPNSEDIDFFKFTLDEASLIELKALPDFRDTIDSGNIYIWFNDGTSKPIFTLYDSTGGYLQEGYGEMSYNASYGGTYYCRVDSSYNGWGIWHKYGFSITSSNIGSINVQNPNGGETYNGGEKIYITWEADSAITRVKIECSLNNGGEWFRLASYFSEKNYRWVVPYIKNASSQVLVRVTAEDISNPPSDISDAPFTITAASPDPYEPNNTLNEAYNADINDTLWGAMTMKSSSNPNSEDIDFFKFTLGDASLIELEALPDFRDTIDTGNIYVGFNDGTSKPILTLYDSTGGYIEEGYGKITYNIPSGGTYYCRVDSSYNGWGIWHKYGLRVMSTQWKEFDEIQIDTDDYTISVDPGGDTVYTAKKSGQNTKLDIDLSLDKREQGLVIAGIFDTNTVFPVPDTLLQVKTISIDAPEVFDASLKYADIVIPYSEDELGTIPESALAVYALNDLRAFNALGWEPVPFTHDQVNNKLSVHVTSLNILSVFGVDNTIDIINTPSILPRFSTMHIGYNPCNGFVTIKYQLASEGIAKLEVYNTMGKKVYTVFDSNRKAGYYATRWSVGIMSAGIYYFRLTTLNSRIVKKAVVIK